eukprot:14590712-Alexandrium_andersonii.AAC.1
MSATARTSRCRASGWPRAAGGFGSASPSRTQSRSEALAGSLFYLWETIQLWLRPGVKVVNFGQCPRGADAVKPHGS